MAKKAPATEKPKKAPASRPPQFPWTKTPNALRLFLKAIPDKPLPPKVDFALLNAWGISDNNARSILRVLESVDLINASGIPTSRYETFMQPKSGPAVLGQKVREVYAPFFQASHKPYSLEEVEITRLFNINSGGGESSLRYQRQTFKVLCEFCTFDGAGDSNGANGDNTGKGGSGGMSTIETAKGPSIHIDLHIHLPENKSVRDYQAIIEDIGRFIYRSEQNADGQ